MHVKATFFIKALLQGRGPKRHKKKNRKKKVNVKSKLVLYLEPAGYVDI